MMMKNLFVIKTQSISNEQQNIKSRCSKLLENANVENTRVSLNFFEVLRKQEPGMAQKEVIPLLLHSNMS